MQFYIILIGYEVQILRMSFNFQIMNKLPPIGNILKKQVALLPLYKLDIKCEPNRVVEVTLSITNYDQLLGHKSTAGESHRVTLIIGDSENNLLLFEKIL